MNTAFYTTSILCFIWINNICVAKEEDIVEKWASRLGKELWDLGLSVTRVSDIKQSYKNLNARVLPTDGEKILHNIVSNVNRLLKQKMDSVMCLIEEAERLSQEYEPDNMTYTYFNSKYSPLPDIIPPNIPGVNYTFYKTIEVNPDHHFYNIKVNTSHSAVHVPSDVYDQGEKIKNSLRWSEDLDLTFITNYEADPTMSWQYFGSSTGFLRHYPALSWAKDVEKADIFDCRTRFWYIEAATCTKDILILMDYSGSMFGVKTTIANLTAYTVLDTLSNNDFINIVRFNKSMLDFVPCFPQDMLVQATPENILLFKKALFDKQKVIPASDKADFRLALKYAFELMTKYRKEKECPDDICNQAIILITDTAPENVTDIFEKYNWFQNRTKIPVRVFIFLIGKEVPNIKEVEKITCMNRGFLGHIKTLEQVRNEVLKYISVFARPMVLQAIEHPLSWTHSFVDATGQHEAHLTPEGYRFMTSVSGPAFDKTSKQDGNETSLPELLGVAGTDVLIADIKSLTLPYKIGANGYAFVITNNGYLLFHPDLRPVYQCLNETCVKTNYNSVDLTEVELLDDGVPHPRQPHKDILKLRELMVNGTEGAMPGLKIKFHYDEMRRVGVETRNYFFAPLNNTPFTMGLVLPHSYGNFWIKAGDEIKKSKQMGIPVTNYFKGNWRIHPDWVYCDYHRTSARWFNSSEAKLLHFLDKISSKDWEWKERFTAENTFDQNSEDKCNRPSIDETEYYCDKELMQLLVFDAKITEVSYKTSKWAAKDRRETELVKRFDASLRFLATQSGLTRWQNIPEPVDSNEQFGSTNNRALEEVWYKSAVLYHQLDSEAFVFSVPYNAAMIDNVKVTASYAIFPKDGGHEAPGSVVGFQINHTALFERFKDITSNTKCENCTSCSSDWFDCYLVDGNGYVVLSEVKEDTGRFFGEVDGAVMEAMISKNFFRHVTMFDYQAICSYDLTGPEGSGSVLISPFKYIMYIVEWFIGKIMWFIIESEIHKFVFACDDEDDYYEGRVGKKITTRKPFPAKPKLPKTIFESCDNKGDLYLLQNMSEEGISSKTLCSRPYYVKRVKHTNLLLIVVNPFHSSCYRKLSANMERVNSTYEHSSCEKLNLNSLPRRVLSGCYNTHKLEKQFYQCSDGSVVRPVLMLLILLLICFSRN